MIVTTRFAPSPTGVLHLGGARTALFNWLYARHHGGRNLLRIEDTDLKRSTPAARDAIIDGVKWLGLNWDGEILYQSHQAARHKEVALALLASGNAYHCYATPEELIEMRELARSKGHPMRYDGRWRDRDPKEAVAGVSPVIRLKVPQQGETTIDDQVQGLVRVSNSQLDDMVLLRADGTPTYMLSVVVDDHDSGITHVIRGDDHLTNAARQLQLYTALEWDIPSFAHISLIHGVDGTKLSKRHGATGISDFKKMGYLPEALCNYLLRLGWSHGDDEVISLEEAVKWFDLDGVGKGPARFDIAKLGSLNAHYLRKMPKPLLLDTVLEELTTLVDRTIKIEEQKRVLDSLDELKKRSKTINELVENALIYVKRPKLPLVNPKAAKLLEGNSLELLSKVNELLAVPGDWEASRLEKDLRNLAENLEVGLGKLAQPLRAAVTGTNVSPSIFEVIEILGREETLVRIENVVGGTT